jgi:hypothetical protein
MLAKRDAPPRFNSLKVLFNQISQQEVISIEKFNHWHRNPVSAINPAPNQKKLTHTAQV